MTDDSERKEIIHDLLSGAIPVNPQSQGGYVSREEFMATVRTIESKIENASLRQKQWVLTGCIAILVSFGGGYISLVNKLDRLTEALPGILQKQTSIDPWIARQQQHDFMQDEALKRLDKNYQPIQQTTP